MKLLNGLVIIYKFIEQGSEVKWSGGFDRQTS